MSARSSDAMSAAVATVAKAAVVAPAASADRVEAAQVDRPTASSLARDDLPSSGTTPSHPALPGTAALAAAQDSAGLRAAKVEAPAGRAVAAYSGSKPPGVPAQAVTVAGVSPSTTRIRVTAQALSLKIMT